MKVSALIPTYNRRAEVVRAIDSVFAQTVPVDEIIVVDDGSTDGSAEAIRDRYGSRVVLLEQKNAGVSAARNRGIREAQGEWIAFLDSDDTWLPTKIERQLEALAALGGEFGLCLTDCAFDGDPRLKSSAFERSGFAATSKLGAVEKPAQYMLAGREFFWLPSLMVRRSLLEELRAFNESLVIGEDTDLLFRLCFKTRFCFVAEQLVRIDTIPSRRNGLGHLYNARDDRKFENLARLYNGWLTMPEVAGTAYERSVRDILRGVFYNSAECKLHERRIGSAFGELRRLKGIGDSYPSILATLVYRKLAKFRNSQAHAVAGAHPYALVR